MSNDLIPADVFGEVSTQLGSDEDFADLGAPGFLRRLELKSKGKLIDTGKVKPGHYCVTKSAEDADDLGDSIDIMPLSRRPKAIDMSDKANIVTSFDRESDVFLDIQKRSGQQNSNCQYGASFLVVERTTGQLYELFLGSASNRRVVGEVSDFLPLSAANIAERKLTNKKPHGPLAVTLKSKFVENKARGFSWFVMVPKPCSNAFTKDQVPDAEKIKEELYKFTHPNEGDTPDVEAPEPGKKTRAR